MPRTSLLIKRGLGYPGNAFSAGFNPNHIAARGISPGNGFSGIALGANVVNLLSGKSGVIGGAGSVTTKFVFGIPSSFCNNDINITFAGNSTANAPNVTFAWIGIPFDITGFNTVLSNNQASVGTQLLTNSNNTFVLNNWAGTNFGAAVTFVANAPHFIAMSGNSATSVGVSVNLLTGRMNTNTGSGATPNTGLDGNYSCGDRAFSGASTSVYWSAGMFSSTFTPLASLLQWAADPWSFWYPSTKFDFGRAAAAATYFPFNGAFVLP